MKMLIKDDRFMMGAMYAPFCRTIAAPMEEWDNDFKNMKELGYTCVHGFCEWHDVEKEKGVFDFTAVDYMIECAHRNGIVPLINIATINGVGYYSPRWLMQEYKGKGFVDNDGYHDIENCEYRIPCIDDPWYSAYAKRYLKAVAKHFAGNEKVGGYVIWGEPGLTRNGKNICYCEHTVARFRKWLENKYKDIETLNALWSSEGPTQYIDFNEINPPTGAIRQRGSYASWNDWRSFMDDNLCNHIHEADTIFKAMGATQPTIAELFCYVGNHSSNSIDVWKLAKVADIVGVSNFMRPGRETAMAMTVANSISKPLNKNCFVVEALGGGRFFTKPHLTPSSNELVSEAVQMIGGGAKGLMYWCYRPRMSDVEGAEFGLVQTNGKVLPRAEKTGQISKAFQNYYPLFHNAERKSEVAIFTSQTTQHIAHADNASELYNDAQQGAMLITHDSHITPELINEEFILKGNLKNYKVLLLPCVYMIDEAVIDKIEEFAANGGLVIADYSLGLKNSIGFCYSTAPGGKLTDLFGIEKIDTVYLEHESLIEENELEIKAGSFIDVLDVIDAKVNGYFGENPISVSKKYKNGECHYFGNQFFANYKKNPSKKLRDNFIHILKNAGVTPYINIDLKSIKTEDSSYLQVLSSCLSCSTGEKIISLVNASYNKVVMDISLKGTSITNMLTNEIMPFTNMDSFIKTEVSLAEWESIMILIK